MEQHMVNAGSVYSFAVSHAYATGCHGKERAKFMHARYTFDSQELFVIIFRNRKQYEYSISFRSKFMCFSAAFIITQLPFYLTYVVQ